MNKVKENKIFNTDSNYVVGYYNEHDVKITMIELRIIFSSVILENTGVILVSVEKEV